MSVGLCVCPSAPFRVPKKDQSFNLRQLLFHCIFLYFLIAQVQHFLPLHLPFPRTWAAKCASSSLWRLISRPMSTPSSALPTWTSPQGPLSWRSGSLPRPGQRRCSGTGDADQAPGPPSCKLWALPSPSAGRGQCVANMIFLFWQMSIQCNVWPQNLMNISIMNIFVHTYLNIWIYLNI